MLGLKTCAPTVGVQALCWPAPWHLAGRAYPYFGKYLASPRGLPRNTTTVIWACAVWLCKPLYTCPKDPLKTSAAHSCSLFSHVPFRDRLPHPSSHPLINKLPCGFVIHYGSVLLLLNYNIGAITRHPHPAEWFYLLILWDRLSHPIQNGPELALQPRLSPPNLPSVGITGVYSHSWFYSHIYIYISDRVNF